MVPGLASARAMNSGSECTPSDAGTATTVGACATMAMPAKSATGSNGRLRFIAPKMAWAELVSSTV